MISALLDTSKVIVGQSGLGKTVTAKAEVQQLLDQRRHVAIIDPTGVWWGMRLDPAGEPNGAQMYVFGGEHGDVQIRPDQGAAIARIIVEQAVSAIVDLSSIDNSRDWRRFMADFVAELRKKPIANFHLVVDEADEFAAERPADDVGYALRENMVWIAKRGRVRGFVPTYITQRTAEIAWAVISQVQTVIVHGLVAHVDQAPIEKYLKAHGSAETRKELMSSLAELAIGERWIYSPRLKILERGFTPPLATFDSSRTPGPGEQLVEPRSLAQLDVSAIAAALSPGSQISDYPDDTIPGDPAAALQKGGEVGSMLAERDHRIAALQAEIADLRAEIEHLREVDAECDGYNAGLTQIEELVIALRSGAWRADLHSRDESSGVAPDIQTAPAHCASAAEVTSPAAGPGNSPTASDVAEQGSSLPPRRVRLARSIAWAHAYLKRDSVPRTIVAWIAQTTAASSTFERDLGAMRTAGLIYYPAPGEVALTSAGRDIAPQPALPRSRETLWQAVAARLEPRRVRLIRALWDGKPKSRESLAHAVETSPASSTFEKDLGRLRTLGLLDYPDPGRVVLAELLR